MSAIFLWSGLAAVEVQAPARFLYTEAASYQPGAVGGERFPAGASVQVVANGQKRPLAPGFAASADPCISFDDKHILFSGKRTASDPWQIWETPLAGGTPRRLTAFSEDAITPFYLPAGHIVYARRTPSGFQLETIPLDGGEPLRITFGSGDHLATDVLPDGRILFDAPIPGSHDIFTVYSDGTGVETWRCDHGHDRRAGHQVASGDLVFETGGHLARFTSAQAVEVSLPSVDGQFAGPVAELSPTEWLVAYRPDQGQPFAIYQWKPGQEPPRKVLSANGAQAVQPVTVAARAVPKWHPSALGNRPGANLLCLNTYISRTHIPRDSVASVRVWAQDEAGAQTGSPVVLGEAPVARDGSFFVEAPGERAIRFELLDSAGKTVAAEKGWFWARRGEQRVCVGCHAGPEHAPDNAVPQILEHSTEPVRMQGVK